MNLVFTTLSLLTIIGGIGILIISPFSRKKIKQQHVEIQELLEKQQSYTTQLINRLKSGT